MKVKEIIENCLWKFPSLYGNDELSLYRVLTHLFFGYGHGYSWNKYGEIYLTYEQDEVSEVEHSEGLEKWEGHYKKERPIDIHKIEDSHSLIEFIPDNITDEYLLAVLGTLAFSIKAPIHYHFFVRPSPRNWMRWSTLKFFGILPEGEKEPNKEKDLKEDTDKCVAKAKANVSKLITKKEEIEKRFEDRLNNETM